MSEKSWNRVTIDPEALHANYRLFQDQVGRGVRVMAMVKADAYGHGMVAAARIFAQSGCDAFGVAEIQEGVDLRSCGVRGDIFVLLGCRPHDCSLFFQYDLTPVVFDFASIERISQTAVTLHKEISVHLKIDCGMGRLGLIAEEATPLIQLVESLPGVHLGGVMAHFPLSDDPKSTTSKELENRFSELCQRLSLETNILHIANSGAVFNLPDSYYNMVRPGIGLYGYYPDGGSGQVDLGEDRLQPAMTFTTKVLQVKNVPANYGISYGHTYITKQPSTLAVLPVGYADGYLRALSNRAEVLIHGCRVPIRGRVCMNMCMVDVSKLHGVQPGDEVVLLGSQGDASISADEIGRWANTISYEVLCLFGNNNEREYLTKK